MMSKRKRERKSTLLPKTVRLRRSQIIRDRRLEREALNKMIIGIEDQASTALYQLRQRCPHENTKIYSAQYERCTTECDDCGKIL